MLHDRKIFSDLHEPLAAFRGARAHIVAMTYAPLHFAGKLSPDVPGSLSHEYGPNEPLSNRPPLPSSTARRSTQNTAVHCPVSSTKAEIC